LIFERKDLSKVLGDVEKVTLHDWFLNYGFNIVQEPVAFELEHIEFCQMHPVCVAGKWRMVRNFQASLSKDAVSIRSRTPQELRQWLWCVGKCGVAMASGVPVQQEYYKMFIRSGMKGGRLNHVEGRSGLTWFSAGLAATEAPVEDSTRVSFWKAFGVDPAEQMNMEADFSQYTLPPNAPKAESYYNYLDI
jgi:hypothetical protein